MNTIISNKESLYQHKKYNHTKPKSLYNPSFKGIEKTIITTVKDKATMNVFSQHYGDIGDNIGKELYNLTSRENIIKKSSRFSINEGTLSIKDKNIVRSLAENGLAFITLPLYGMIALLKKLQAVPMFKDTAEKMLKTPMFSVPDKINKLDNKTDILKGMFEKTNKTVAEFVKMKMINPANVAEFAKDKNITTEELLAIYKKTKPSKEEKKLIEQLDEYLKNNLLSKINDKKYQNDPLIQEANEYIKENLYKVSNKFFDKHTGNFNTAYERPLNRIISGAIPIAFLANDAYNLSVLCGDKKEDSEKEADARTKQEIIRVGTTAYIQLLIFGAFTKQVNTIPWFAPVASAVTVFFSEIFSRKKLDRPIFFLSKDTAQEYNKKHALDDNKSNQNKLNGNKSVKTTDSTEQAKVAFNNKNIGNTSKQESKVFNNFSNIAKSSNGTSFSAANKETQKEKPKKALMNFDTFKKSVMFLIGTFFTLSFLKNSSFTKDSFIVQGAKNIGKYLKENVYEPLAYKEFSITHKKFGEVMESLKNVGCGTVADGHEFIEKKYADPAAKNVIKMTKYTISSKNLDIAAEEIAKQAKDINSELTEKEIDVIKNAVKTAVRLNTTSIAEKKLDSVAKKAIGIISNKKVKLNDENSKLIEQLIEKELRNQKEEVSIKIATKIKPFVDIVTEPFKFAFSAARLPFKLVKSAINLTVSPIEKKAADAALGKAELSKFEQSIHKIMTEIFGEEEGKEGKISQIVFANAMEQLEKKTLPYRKAEKALKEAIDAGKSEQEIAKLEETVKKAKHKLSIYAHDAVEKSFNGVTQSSNKNTDIALMSKLASSTVTSAFLVADNYNMVMMKSNGENKDEAKEKANERIIQRLSGLFYQALFINWFNATFRSTYNSSLTGMAAVVVPNTLTTEILMRKSIGMPVGRMTLDELNEMDKENENRKGILGKYFEFMRLLTGKKPLKDRIPKEKAGDNKENTLKKDNKDYLLAQTQKNNSELQRINKNSTNVLDQLVKK